MAEKETPQRKAAESEGEQVSGKTMSAPVFQLFAGDGGDGANAGSGGAKGGGSNAGTSVNPIQKQDDKDGKKEKAQTKKPAAGYSTHVGPGAIVTIPTAATGALPILVVYGGMHYATKDWMKAQMPANFFQTHIISFSNYTTYYQKGVKPEIEAAMTKDGVKGYYKALIGFSAGGYRIEGAKNDEKWSLLGMIDPVVTNGANYPCLAYMVWTKWKAKNDPRELLHKRITNGEVQGKSIAGGGVENHAKMPALWFEKFGALL